MSSWPAAIRHSCWPAFRPRLLLGAHPDRPDEESRRSSFGASARNRRHTPPPPRAGNSTDDDFSAVEPPSRAETPPVASFDRRWLTHPLAEFSSLQGTKSSRRWQWTPVTGLPGILASGQRSWALAVK